MCAKKILSLVACFSVMLALNLFAAKEDYLGKYGNSPWGNPWGNFGNSPWGNKVAKVEYKKKKIAALMELLATMNSIKKEISPELTEKQNARAEQLKQIEELNKKIRILMAQKKPINDEEGELRALIEMEGALNLEINGMLEKLKADPKFSNLDANRQKGLQAIVDALTEEETSNDPWGMLIAKALAGPNYNNALDDDAKIKNWTDGAFKGGTVLLVGALSEVVREKAKDTIGKSVGTVWDYCFDGFINFWQKVRNVLLHSSNEPFDPQKLAGWQDMILTAYNDIDVMLRNGLLGSTRNLDSVSRQFDDSNTEAQTKKEVDMWASLATGYAEQFTYFITLFEKRREYYDEDDIVVFYSNQICQMLQATCKLLVNSKSLKDLDSKLENQRTIIPAIKTNLLNLFKQLIAEVSPKNYSMKPATASTASTYKPTYYNPYPGTNNNDGTTQFNSGF